jgi:hypothetical protein
MLRALPLALLVAAPTAFAAARIHDVHIEQRGDEVDVVVTASEPLTFQTHQQMAPAAVVLDLFDVDGAAPQVKNGDASLPVTLKRMSDRTQSFFRLTYPSNPTMNHDVSARGSTLTLSVFPRGQRAVRMDLQGEVADTPIVKVASVGFGEGSMGKATASDAVLLAQAGPSSTRQMTYIGFKNSPTQSRIFARLNDAAEFSVKKEGDNLIVLEIKNATIPLRNNRNHLDTTFFDSPVKMITPSEIEDATPTIRIAIEMKSSVPYETKVEGKEIAIYFKK